MTDTNDSRGDDQQPTLEELLQAETTEGDGTTDDAPAADPGPPASETESLDAATDASELDALLAEVGTSTGEGGESAAADQPEPSHEGASTSGAGAGTSELDELLAEAGATTDGGEPVGTEAPEPTADDAQSDAAADDLLAAADAASERTAVEQAAAEAAAAEAALADASSAAATPGETATATVDDGPPDDGAPDDDQLVVQYPSADFPPTPAFRLNIPPDWVALAATQAEMVVRAPEPIDGYHANVIVNSRRVPPSENPAAALAASVNNEFERAGYEVIESVGKEHDVTPAHAATVRFTTPNDTPVEAHQLHVYVPSSERSAHVLSVTGTVSANADDELRAGLLHVVRSLRLAAPNPQS